MCAPRLNVAFVASSKRAARRRDLSVRPMDNVRDLEPPRTGIFDGLRIVIDPDVGFEMQCFLLLHLFGHSVQWVAPSLEHELADLQHTEDRTRFMQVLHAYELEAAGFGMQLMHQVGVTTLDGWYSDFVGTDWRYVERYY